MKGLRLVRLGKMLRLARIKRILDKWCGASGTPLAQTPARSRGRAIRRGVRRGDADLAIYKDVGTTLFIIILLLHIMACIFYTLGTEIETLPTGQVR